MTRSTRPLVGTIGAGLVALTLAAYSGALANGFVDYDDQGYVTENPHVRAGVTPSSVAWALTSTSQANWHPVTWLSHMTDVSLFGLNAGRHHLVSVLLHAANTLALFLLLSAMTGAVWRSGLVAGLFCVHPLHVESVAWIAERKDVLSTLLWLATTAAWLRWIRLKSAGSYLLVVVLFALGLAAKPMLVTLPFTLLLLDFWPLGRPVSWREKTPLFAMAAASCLITMAAQRAGGAVQGLDVIPLGDRIANSALSYGSYLAKTFRPVGLAVFYPYPHVERLHGAVLLSAAFFLAATATAVLARKRAPYVTFGWLWFVGTLVPVIGWVQVGAQGSADRYTYVPLIGVFVAIAWALGDLALLGRSARAVCIAASSLALAGLLLATRAEVRHWASAEALFSRALATTQDNWLAHNNLAAALSAAGRQDEAIAHLTESLRIRPDYADAHYNLGVALARSGKPAEAIEALERARRIGPDSAKLENNLAGALAAQGRVEEAVVGLRRALTLDPDNVEAHFNLASAALAAGRSDEAIEHFGAVVRLSPGDAEARAGLARARAARR